MPLSFSDVVDHTPFSGEAFRWRMGVRTLPAERWLQLDDLRPLDLLEKAQLTGQYSGRTFVAEARSEPAAREARDLVAAELRRSGLELGPERSHPLETAGLSVQEDLCLLEPIDGEWIMTAGSVCFPTRWDLESKLGRSLAEIHAPVPDFAEHLSQRVDRFFDRMPAGSLAYRLNWSLVGESSRRLEASARQAPATLPTDPGADLFVRIERQTLRRLSEHDAVVFGIRIHTWPLGQVAAELPPDAFAHELESLPADVARYKNLDGMREELVEWLRRPND